MTASEMNASLSKKMFLCAVVATGASGCAVAFDPATDPTSPVAPRVQALVDANRAYPRWEDFPSAPVDLPAPVEVAARVNTLRVTGGALAGEVSRIEWTLQDAEAFERDVVARVAASQPLPATARTAEEIEAFAQSLRERGRAPPPVPRQ